MSTTQATQNYKIKTFSYEVPSVNLTEEDFNKIKKSIQKAEVNASANILCLPRKEFLQKIIFDNFEIKNYKQKIKKIVVSPKLYSKSKQWNTTATQLTLEFYKNGNLKKVEAERKSFPNYLCYSGYAKEEVLYYPSK
jgi:hypothetical protein